MTLLIVIVTCAISIIAFSKRELFNKLLFAPNKILIEKEWYRMVSHGFIHADWMHLFFNMLALYMFGGIVEDYFDAIFGGKSTYYFILLYI